MVAQIGEVGISVRDFRVSYELSPPTHQAAGRKGVTERKASHLSGMIETRLLAFAGRAAGFAQAADVQRLLLWYEKQAILRELYLQEIRDQINVNEDEARTAFAFLNEKALVRQFLVKSQPEAAKLYQRFRQGESFEQIALDVAGSQSEFKRLLTASEFTWGELDENLETAIFGLNRDELSAPIKTRAGYHLVQLLNRKKNVFLTEYGYRERQHYVETIIRRRKEARLAREYARRMMSSLRPRAVSHVLLEFTERAKKAVRVANSETYLPAYLQVHQLNSHLQDMLEQDLVLYNSGTWTVGHVLDLVGQMPPNQRPDLTDARALPLSLSQMVRDEFLVDDGYKQNLHERATVKDEVTRIEDQIMASRMRAALLDTVNVSQADVRDYYERNIEHYKIPEMVRVREIMVRDKVLADSLYRAIKIGSDISGLAKDFSVRKWAVERGGDLGYFTRDAFGEIGKQAIQMEVGGLSPPVPVKVDGYTVGYSVFSVTARKSEFTPALSSLHEKVARSALAEKKNRVLQSFLSGVRTNYPVSVDESVLAAIKTLDAAVGTGKSIDILKLTRY